MENLESNPETTSDTFDGGTFEIIEFPESANGLQVETRESLPRDKKNPHFKRVAEERASEPLQFRRNILRPRDGETVAELKAELLAMTRDGKPLIQEKHIVTKGDHLELKPGFAPLVGLRNLGREGDTLSFDIQATTFSTYRAIRDVTESEEALSLANPSATACILLTEEEGGDRKMILQSRSKNNRFYGGVPGASIAGMMGGKMDPENKGKLEPINTESIRGNNRKELEEELGLSGDDIAEVRITGLASDKLTVHDEFLLSARTTLTTAEIVGKVEQRKKEQRPGDQWDFEGNFVVLDATPETVEVLLTQMHCPLPPTHAAAFLATGHSLMLERDGKDAADAWKKNLQTGLRENTLAINALVQAHWAAHPEEAAQSPKGAHKLDAYDPAYLPEEQGLPSFEEELVRLGLKV